MTTPVDFSLDQYATFTKTFTVYDEANNVVNLDDFEGEMVVRPDYDSQRIIFQANTADANTMAIDGIAGTVAIFFTDEDFANYQFQAGQNLDTTDLVYDLRLTNANGQSFRVASGTITLNRAITR